MTDSPATPDRFAPITEADIAEPTDSGSFSRGRAYYRQDRIYDAVLRGETIQALCEGSDVEPYLVRATLAPTAKRPGPNPRAGECTCPAAASASTSSPSS